MPNSNVATKFTWDAMPKERVTNRIDRRIVSGEQTMVAHVYLEEGAIVPEHSHHNEQLTYILKGKLRFWVGEDFSHVVDVAAGEVLHLPANIPHKAEALEETLDLDIFCPPRQDWLDHTDDYFSRPVIIVVDPVMSAEGCVRPTCCMARLLSCFRR